MTDLAEMPDACPASHLHGTHGAVRQRGDVEVFRDSRRALSVISADVVRCLIKGDIQQPGRTALTA